MLRGRVVTPPPPCVFFTFGGLVFLRAGTCCFNLKVGLGNVFCWALLFVFYPATIKFSAPIPLVFVPGRVRKLFLLGVVVCFLPGDHHIFCPDTACFFPGRVRKRFLLGVFVCFCYPATIKFSAPIPLVFRGW